MVTAIAELLDAKTTMALPEKHYPLSKVAEIAGVHSTTFRRWLERSGYEFNRGARGCGHTAMIPESVAHRVIAEHSIRLAREA